MMKKVVISICVILLIMIGSLATLSGCIRSHTGDSSRVSVDISGDSKYTEEQLNAAVECIKKDFAGYKDCKLVNLEFSNDTENGAVFTGNFETGDKSGDEGFNENSYYDGWSWVLEYKDGQWIEINHGYG